MQKEHNKFIVVIYCFLSGRSTTMYFYQSFASNLILTISVKSCKFKLAFKVVKLSIEFFDIGLIKINHIKLILLLIQCDKKQILCFGDVSCTYFFIIANIYVIYAFLFTFKHVKYGQISFLIREAEIRPAHGRCTERIFKYVILFDVTYFRMNFELQLIIFKLINAFFKLHIIDEVLFIS